MSTWDLGKASIEDRYKAAGQTGLGSIEKRAQTLMLDLAWNASRHQEAYNKAVVNVVDRGTSWDTLGHLIQANAELRVSNRYGQSLAYAHKKAEEEGKDLGGIEEVLILRQAVNRAMESLSLGTSTSGISNELDRAEAKVWIDLNSRLMRHFEVS